MKYNTMKKMMLKKLERVFNEYKEEYSHPETTDNRKQALIQLMQENLKERWGKEGDLITCLDGQEYSLKSNIVTDLYAIDGALKAETCSNEMTEIAVISRKEAEERNTYGPAKPYLLK